MPSINTGTWPVEFDQKLRDCVAAGLSSSETSSKLIEPGSGGWPSRCAVIGRAQRMGLKWVNRRGQRPALEKGVKPLLHFQNAPVAPAIEEPPAIEVRIKESLPVKERPKHKPKGMNLLTRTSQDCAWPLEGKSREGFPVCCGKAVVPRKPYCSPHCHTAFQRYTDPVAEIEPPASQ